MLLLNFHLGDGRYAISGHDVIRVLPLVRLQKIHNAPPLVAGLLNYGGTLVPVIDLCQLLLNRPCEAMVSTRIIMVEYRLPNNETRPLGLIAEDVTEATYRDTSDLISPFMSPEDRRYLSGAILDGEEMIHLLDVQTVVGEEIRAMFHDQWAING